MTLGSLLLLLLLGFLFIAAEIIFIPGTTVVGLIGALISVLSIALSFFYLPNTQAWLFTVGSVFVSLGLGYAGLRSKTWKRFEIKSALTSKAPGQASNIQAGMTGKTTSRCNPIGQAEIQHQIHEVYALGDYLESGAEIQVERIENQYIYIKSIS